MKQFDFLTDDEKYRFALFLKRITYEAALGTTTNGDDKKEAYWTLEIIDKVQTALANQGYAPR